MPQGSHYQPGSMHTGAQRQAYYRPHTSMGATGHWVKTAGILAPLVIGEFVKDNEQKWRLIRLASVATALVSEGLYTSRIVREREAARERELICQSPG
jgi:hypothetical protein